MVDVGEVGGGIKLQMNGALADILKYSSLKDDLNRLGHNVRICVFGQMHRAKTQISRHSHTV